ncbi:MAG: hypothetical protein KIC54_04965 [Clostridium sp.]|nr:hypothetical protein [Clostridium sp.]
MRKERSGYKIEDLLVIKSPETGIAAKVELNADGTRVASLMNWTDENKLGMKAIEEEEKPAKKKIIVGMILFYLAITGIFICISGVAVGLVTALYFIAMTFAAIFVLSQQIIYAVKHKEKVQYESIFRKVDTCYMLGKEINEANIKNITVKPFIQELSDRMNINNIRQIFLTITITPFILLVSYANIIALLVMEAVIFVIYITSIKNEKLLEILNKTNELLVYRKPTEQQIEDVLFGFNYLKNCEETEVARWFCFH